LYNKKNKGDQTMDRRAFLKSGMMLGALAALTGVPFISAGNADKTVGAEAFAGIGDGNLPFKKIVKSDEEWKRLLTPAQFQVTRKKGTEAPYSSPLTKLRTRGTYMCVCCNLPLFSSKSKYDSGTGWASFWAPIAKINVREEVDRTMPQEVRTEILCNRCDAHLGHVFDDGPKPTGLRYCMNGVALRFVKAR
jgi:peptide-methionine (R)-S-oxide reductase